MQSNALPITEIATDPHPSHPHTSQHTQAPTNAKPANNGAQRTRNEEPPSVSPSQHPSIPPSPHPSVPPAPSPSVTIGGLAELLGATRTTIRDYILRLNFRISTQHVGPRRKRVACLTAEQAHALTAAYQADLALGPELPSEADPATPTPADRNLGVVYLLQLEPDHDPGRFKVGFSHRPWERLNDLLTVAPLAQCLAMWPARRNWERTAIEAISQTSTQIREEVYRAENIHEALAAGEKFFASLPTPIPTRRPSPSSSSSSSPPSPSVRNRSPNARGAPPARQRVPLQGREAAPPGSPTSRRGQAAGGAEQPSLPTASCSSSAQSINSG